MHRRWSRIASGVLGIGFVAGSFYAVVQNSSAPEAAPPTAGLEPDEPSPSSRSTGTVELFRFAGPDVSPHGLELTDFTATSARSDPVVGDVVAVRFTLRNDAGGAVEVSTFVAARSPSDENADTSASAFSRLPVGEAVPVTASVTVDAPGQWTFWPCYETEAGACPDEWQARSVTVDE